MVKIQEDVYQNRQEKLKILITENYKNIRDFCIKHAIDYSAVHRYISGNMRIGNIAARRFEQIFHLKTGDLDTAKRSEPIITFPLYDVTGVVNSIEDILKLPATVGRTFNYNDFKPEEHENIIGFVCHDDSMSPHIRCNWNVLVNISKTEILDGELFAVLFNDRVIFRDVFLTANPGEYLLRACNEKFDDLIVKAERIKVLGMPFYIFGKFYN
jgi:hypothetical protein